MAVARGRLDLVLVPRDRSIAAGASEWMTKPVNPDELLALIGIWLYPIAQPAEAAL